MKTRYGATIAMAVTLSLAGLAGVTFAENKPVGKSPIDHVQQLLDETQQSLSLTQDQNTLWEEAESYTVTQMKAEFEAMRTRHDDIKTTLSSDNPDLHALVDKLEQNMDTHVTENKRKFALWLSVYDSLSMDQQAVVRSTLNQEIIFMEKMRRQGPPPAGMPPKGRTKSKNAF